MPLESGTYIDDFVTTNPLSTDSVAQGDDQMRWMKSASKATFPNATKEFYFPTAVNVAFADSPYTVPTTTGRNLMIRVDATNGSVTVTLPAVASAKAGAQIRIIRLDNTSNTVTIDGSGSETINSTSSITLARTFGQVEKSAVILESNGTNWSIVGRNKTPTEASPYTTAGDTEYFSGTLPTRLAIGAAGRVYNSSGTAPQWVTASTALDSGIGSTASRLMWRGASGWEQFTLGAVLSTATTTTGGDLQSTDFLLILDSAGTIVYKITLANFASFACSSLGLC